MAYSCSGPGPLTVCQRAGLFYCIMACNRPQSQVATIEPGMLKLLRCFCEIIIAF